MFGVRFLDLDFIALKLPCLRLSDELIHISCTVKIQRRLRFMVNGKTNRLGAGHSPVRRAAPVTAGRATTGSAIGPTPALRSNERRAPNAVSPSKGLLRRA